MPLAGLRISLNPPSESLQEFRTETNSYSAEYGRSAGGHIVMSTKSGTNVFHGSAYEYVRNDAFDTRTFFAQTPPPLRYNTFGAAAGGRVIKNKIFFFVNWESARKSGRRIEALVHAPRAVALEVEGHVKEAGLPECIGDLVLKAITFSKSSSSTSIRATCPWYLTLTCPIPRRAGTPRRALSFEHVRFYPRAVGYPGSEARQRRLVMGGKAQGCRYLPICLFVKPASRRGLPPPAPRPRGGPAGSPPGRRRSTLPDVVETPRPSRSPRPGRKGAAYSNSTARSCC